MPGLNGRDETAAAHLADADLARTSMPRNIVLRHSGRWFVSRPKLRFLPAEVRALAQSMEQVNPFKAGGQNLVAAVAVPIQDLDTMHYREGVVNQVRCPFSRLFCTYCMTAKQYLRHLEPSKTRTDLIAGWLRPNSDNGSIDQG